MLFSPKKEWQVIAGQHEKPVDVIKAFILPLLLAGALSAFIGYGFIGDPFRHSKIVGIGYGISNALNCLVVGMLTLYITAFVVNELSPSFESTYDFSKSFQLVAYGATPIMLGQLFACIPPFENLAKFAGAVFSIYSWWLGLPILKNTPASNITMYLLVIFAGLMVVYAVLGALFAALMFPVLAI